MDEEKMQRQMEFIVEQQAQFAAKIGQLEENVRQTQESIQRTQENIQRTQEGIQRTDENVTRLGGVVERLCEIVERVVDAVSGLTQSARERFDDTDRKLAALVDAQIQTEETVRNLGEDVRKTDASVRNLAEAVDRHVTEGHSGRSQAES